MGEIGNLLVFLQAYFDESGKASEHDISSFCGFIAPSDKWRMFHDAWMRVVAFNGLRTPLKATDALRYRRPLSSRIPIQTVSERVGALTPFINAIRQHVSFGVAVAIDCQAFSQLSEADRAILKHEPHYWAFQQALLLIRQYAANLFQIEPDIRVALCCDEEERYSVECLKLFTNIRRTYPQIRDQFVSIGFADDRFFPQLQAADLTASVARQEAGHVFHGKPFDMRPMYELLCANHPGLAPVAFRFMDGNLLAGVARAETEGRAAR
jgi:hypothetical protein